MRSSFYCILFLVSLDTVHAQHADTLTQGPSAVMITGLVDSAFSISNANLGSFTVQEGKDFNITGSKGEVKRTIKSFKGILLTNILTKAKISLANEKDRGKYIIVVTAADGYTAVFTYNELIFSTAGKNTYLLFEEEGKPIDKGGPFVVACTSDVVTGPRHVKWVKEIAVKKIQD
jgi:hypothetical protein